MQRSLEEIISYMEDRFRPYEIFDRQMRKITRELMELGYTLEEITRGVNAFLVKLEPAGTDLRHREKTLRRSASFRILDSTERRWLGRDAVGYLYLLQSAGMIDDLEREEIIGFIVDNEIEVEDGEQLQAVLMDMVLDQELGEEGVEFPAEDDLERMWHNFRRKKLH